MGITNAVTTIFKSKDQTSQNFKKMSKNARKFGEDSSMAFKKANAGATKFGTITKGILAAGVIQKGLGFVTRGLATVTSEFIGFDSAITQSSAKFKGLNLMTAEGQKTLLALKKAARETGATTKFSAEQAAGGLDFYATAGFKAEQAMAVLGPTARLAMAANTDLARTSDIASDSIGIFGLQVENSTQLQKNFLKMSDQMSFTMTSTNTNMESLFETIKGGGTIFTEAGQKMSTFNAIAGTMAARGIKGEKAGVAMRSMMTSLAKATPQAQKVLDSLGVTTKDEATGNFRDLFDILDDLRGGFKGMGSQAKLAAMKTIFGKQTISAASVVLKKTSKDLREYRDQIEKSSGATQKMADIMSKSLENRLLGLKSAAIEVGFQLFSAFGEKGGNAIDKFTGFIRKIDLTPLINGIKSFGAFMEESGALTLLINGVKLLGSVFKLMWSIARPILKALSFIIIPIVDAMSKLLGLLGSVVDKIPGLPASGIKKIGEATGISQIIGAVSGTGGNEQEAAFKKWQQRQAPNKTELESRQQNVNLTGQINVNAPKGSTATAKTTGGGDFDMLMFGVN